MPILRRRWNRSDNSRHRNKQAAGAGLGLPLTKALVGANGAALSIRSRPGEGTLVEVMFTPATTAASRVPAYVTLGIILPLTAHPTFRAMADPSVSMRILYVAPTGIGDAVVTSGVLNHLIRTHPESRITVACGPAAAGLFAGMPNLERIIVTRKRPLALHWLSLWREVVATSWDMVLDFKGSGLAYLLRARRRVLWPGRSDGPMFERCASMLQLSPAPMPVAWTSQADRARAQALLPGQGPYVALCPTAGWKPKTWPADRMAALFRDVARRPASRAPSR